MRSCLWILEPGFWTYGWVHLVGPIGPNVVSRPQAQRSRNFFRDFMGLLVCLMILEKMRSCLRKLEPRFWTYSLITPLPKALGLNCPNLDCPFQAPDHKHQSLGIWKFFISRSINFAPNMHLFSNFGPFLTKLWVFILRKLQKYPSRIFWCM